MKYGDTFLDMGKYPQEQKVDSVLSGECFPPLPNMPIML